MNRRRTIVPLVCTFLLVAVHAFAGGGREIAAPHITLDLPEVSYVSPNASPGVQDELTWSVSISASERMVVKGYGVLVTDESDAEVYRFEERYPQEQPFFQRLFIGVGFARLKEPVTIPDELSWAGERTDGTPAPEGTYTLVVEGWDDQGRTGTSDPYEVVIDNTAPDAELQLPYSVFSPDDDGSKDILIVEQTGSEEQLWTGAFSDSSDNTVFTVTWEEGRPENLIWDGTDEARETVSDGTYSYELTATDLAGNTTTVSADDIVVDTKDTPISLSRNVGSFSPNGDGSGDTVTFAFEVPITDGVDEWTLEILDDEDAVVRTIDGETLPETCVFDGKADSGSTLPEGTYRGRLSILYINGNRPEATSSEFEVDLTPPTASIKAFPLVFSPNGDGRKDTVQIYQETSLEEAWVGRAYNEDNEVVRRIEWRGRAAGTIEWSGRDDENGLVPDGVYRYVLSSTDRAGNYTEAATEPIRVDTRETPISFSVDHAYFSPNADGTRDELRLQPDITDPEGVTKLTITVKDEEGAITRSFVRTEAVEEIAWDGRNDANQPAPNGAYSAELDVVYEHGNNPTASVGPLFIDRSVPSADVRVSERIFSPDGDGSQDEITVRQTDVSTEVAWTGTFTNAAGDTVRTLRWAGKAETFVWDGTDEEGNRLADGHYRYTLTSTDRAANEGSFVVDRITIDTRPTPVSLRIGSSAFSPNGDGIKDLLVLTPVLSVTDNIDNWLLEIRTADDETVRSFRGMSRIPAAVEFDGDDDDGDRLPEGEYYGRISVLYRNGSNPSASSAPFKVDVTKPSADVRVEPALFSPNGDGRKDTTTIIQDGTEEDTWRAWISDSRNRVVRSFTWLGRLQERVVWDGRDDNGRVVPDGQYVYSATATDHAGNSGKTDPVRMRIDTRKPSLSLTSQPDYFSPNGDGVQDTLRVTPTVPINEEIATHVLEILDDVGDVVRRFEGSGIVPPRISWNGTGSDGSKVTDGEYSARMTIEYLKGDLVEAATGGFTVDTEPPSATVATDTTLFSPEGDGNKDIVLITQRTSSEELWEAKITDADGVVVRTEFWQGTADPFVWDGTDQEGSTVADGTYRYELAAQDRAGNSVRRTIPEIVVDTRPTSVAVSASETAISPPEDGTPNALRFNLYAVPEEGIEEWSLVVQNSRGRSVRDLTSGSPRRLPESIAWNGTNEDGNVVDGTYTALLKVVYAKGNTPLSESNPFVVDTRAPTALVSAEHTVFSPDGDGLGDTITIKQQTSSEDLWEARIVSSTGRTVRTIEWSGAAENFVWNGTNDRGSAVPDGTYQYELSSTDRAGNSVTRSIPGIRVDTRPTTVSLSPSLAAFSPNEDGTRDVLRLNLGVGLTEGIETWSLSVIDERGETVRELTSGPRRTVPRSVVWDGRRSDGSIVDGEYRAKLSVRYTKGNRPEALSESFAVDTVVPTAEVDAPITLFSPDGDGKLDSITIEQTTSEEQLWRGTVTNESGRSIRTVEWNGVADDFTWDGTDDGGDTLRDGVYRYTLETTDAAGNGVTRSISDITVDTRAPTARISANRTLFSPDGDGNRDTLVIDQSTSSEETWEGTITDSSGRVITTVTWRGTADDFTWNGNDDRGRKVSDGTYRYRLSATDEAGNSITRTIPKIEVDTRTAVVSVTSSESAISPNDDKNYDTATLSLYTSIEDGIEEWSLEILDADGRAVRDLTSEGVRVPEKLVWDGARDGGRIVDGLYSPRLKIKYLHGEEAEATIRTAILVDTTAPSVDIGISPKPFSPDDDGENDVATISLDDVSDAVRVASWKVRIIDPYDNTFFEWSGVGSPPQSLEWDGYSEEGELVQAAEDYRVVAELTDTLGNTGTHEAILPVDVLVIREGDTLKIRISSIQFAPNSPDFLEFDEEKAERNMKTLRRLAEILRKYSAYQIRIEGHAVSVYWYDEERAAEEEKEELKPLSKARAEAVKDALVDLGIPAQRMETVGMGGTQPVVPHGDLENRWKSRRVEFILLR